MLQSMGSQRVKHDLATEQKAIKNKRTLKVCLSGGGVSLWPGSNQLPLLHAQVCFSDNFLAHLGHIWYSPLSSVQFSSVAQSCPTL